VRKAKELSDIFASFFPEFGLLEIQPLITSFSKTISKDKSIAEALVNHYFYIQKASGL
jgi:hypothetical protein